MDDPAGNGEIGGSDRSERDKAVSRLDAARICLAGSQKQLKGLLDCVRDTGEVLVVESLRILLNYPSEQELTIRDLKKQLEAERRIELRLKTLEERERNRLNRIKQLSGLLVQTRNQSVLGRGLDHIRVVSSIRQEDLAELTECPSLLQLILLTHTQSKHGINIWHRDVAQLTIL